MIPTKHEGAPPNFLTIRAWTHLNVLLLHRPFIAHPHLLEFDLPTLRKYGFAPVLNGNQPGAWAFGGAEVPYFVPDVPPQDYLHAMDQHVQHPHATSEQDQHTDGAPSARTSPAEPKPKPTPARVKVSITSLLVEQRRHRTKKPNPSATPSTAPHEPNSQMRRPTEGIHSSSLPSSRDPQSNQDLPSGASAFFLSLFHPAQVCIQAAEEIISITEVYTKLYLPRKLPGSYVYMLFQAGTIVSSFSINMGEANDGSALGTDHERVRRAHGTAARCRMLLFRCIHLLNELSLSHPSARKLVRILQSLSDVSSTVGAAATASTSTPSTVPTQSTDADTADRAREGQWGSTPRASGSATGPKPTSPSNMHNNSYWDNQSNSFTSPENSALGTLAAAAAVHRPQTPDAQLARPTSDMGDNDRLLLLAGQAEHERSLSAPHSGATTQRSNPELASVAAPRSTEQSGASILAGSSAQPRKELDAMGRASERAAWEPFWNQMPFGENWDSWRTFFTKVTVDDPTAAPSVSTMSSSPSLPAGSPATTTLPGTISVLNSAPAPAPPHYHPQPPPQSQQLQLN